MLNIKLMIKKIQAHHNLCPVFLIRHSPHLTRSP